VGRATSACRLPECEGDCEERSKRLCCQVNGLGRQGSAVDQLGHSMVSWLSCFPQHALSDDLRQGQRQPAFDASGAISGRQKRRLAVGIYHWLWHHEGPVMGIPEAVRRSIWSRDSRQQKHDAGQSLCGKHAMQDEYSDCTRRCSKGPTKAVSASDRGKGFGSHRWVAAGGGDIAAKAAQRKDPAAASARRSRKET
jgi:hypothetical protein